MILAYGKILFLYPFDQPDVVHDHQIDGSKEDRGCRDWAADGDQGLDSEELSGASDGESGDGCGFLVGNCIIPVPTQI